MSAAIKVNRKRRSCPVNSVGKLWTDYLKYREMCNEAATNTEFEGGFLQILPS